ncbi:Plipastatin synthase subunit C [compost metagenome]
MFLMKRSDIKNIYRLSPMQMNMYHSYIQNPESEVYHQHVSNTISYSFDIERLEDAFTQLVHKHDALRTIFHTVKDNVVQVVLHHRKPSFNYVDLSIEASKVELCENYIQAEKAKRFQLSKDNLLQLTVLKLDDHIYQFLWSFHHIILDGWSFSLILEDLFCIYFDLDGSHDTSPPFSKYIQWLYEQDVNEAKLYWKKILSGYEQSISLSIPKHKMIADAYKSGQFKLQLSSEETNNIAEYCKSIGISMHAFVTTIWGLLLCQYGNQNDVVFGSVVSGRSATLERSSNMIGLMINTIPVRVSYDGNDSVECILKQTQLHLYESEPYSYYDLSAIQAENQLQIEHILVYENYPQIKKETLQGNGLQMIDINGRERINYSFCLEVIPGENLSFVMLYNALIYDVDIITRLADHLHYLINTIIQNPSKPVMSISMMTLQEQFQITEVFNDTRKPYPINQTIYHYFEKYALKYKENVALRFHDKNLTYGCLLEKVTALSQILLQKGIQKNRCVGLMIPRSFEMIVGILAIWKAGGIYVPISSDLPDARKEIMLNDCAASVLLTTQTQTIPNFSGEVLFIKLQELEINKGFEPRTEVTESNDIAYIIYTSGSTGVPKGVAVSHESVINRIEFENDVFPLDVQDVVMQKTAISFDVSIYELLCWVSTGSALSLLPPGGEKDPYMIIDTIRLHQVTVIHFVPSMLSSFLNHLEENRDGLDQIESLRYVVTSGEELRASHANRFYSLFDNRSKPVLVNKYGPTEATVDVSYYVCTTDLENEVIPIGKPMPNIQLYVIDRYQRLAPIDALGELYISGIGLAVGYLNKPELTAQKYVNTDIFQGKRLYKTGDLVRWRADGNIDYYGRMDRQVKVRGFRIELNEIEANLLSIQGVYEAHVLYQENIEKDQELFAFYVGVCSSDDIRKALLRCSPSYMVPRYIVQLDAMPYRSNGKVDSNKLLDYTYGLDSICLVSTGGIPHNHIEAEILSCWRDIFGNAQIGMDDDFFALGGHSILALRIASYISNTYSIRLMVTTVMEYPTVRQLALYVQSEMKCNIEIPHADPVGVYPVTAAQQRMYIMDIKSSMSGGYNMPQAFLIRGILDMELLRKSFEKVIQRHDILRSSFEIKQGRLSQVVHPEIPMEFTVDPPIHEQEIAQFIQRAIQPFQFTQLPLIRVALVPIIGKETLFFFDMHHIISDGTSLGIFVKELAAIYNGETLPDVDLQYHDFSQWQLNLLSDERISKQQAFWEDVFMSQMPVLNLPKSYELQVESGFSTGKTIFVEMNHKDSLQIHTFVQEQGTTLFMFFMSVYHIMLHKITLIDDITVATVVSNRSHPALQNTIGLFINTILIRSQPEPHTQFTQFLRDIALFCMKAFQHAEFPYEMLVDYIMKQNCTYMDASKPIVNTMLIMQNIDMQMPSFGEVEITPYAVSHPVAKYELQLEVFDVNNCIRFSLDYDSHLYSDEFVYKLMQQFITTALFVSENPNTFIGEIPFD